MSFLDFPDDDPKRRSRRPYLLFILATLAVGAVGSFFTEPSIATWYRNLAHPSFTPPDWVFAPVWTGLYILMAVAAARVWKVAGFGSAAIGAYGVQLLLNLGWSLMFFALHQIGWALVEIAVLWLAILVTALLFWRADRLAGVMLLPYLAWTSFAALLNQGFLALNG